MLHSKSSHINFLTVQTGENRTAKSILKGLKGVINTYSKRGFEVADLHADNEFDIKDLKSSLEPTSVHIYGKEEHVGTIERSVRTVKQRCRALCHALPYKRYTKLMTNSLVENAIYWMNSFPSSNGVSKTLSPASIVLGRGRPDFSKNHIAFGSYAMVYDGTTNNMRARVVPAIALKPSNEHGGSYFMSLISGQRLHSYQWTELPIADEIIERVHEIAKKENQPYLHGGVPIFEWSNGNIIEDDEDMDEGADTDIYPNNVTYNTTNRATEVNEYELENQGAEEDTEIDIDNVNDEEEAMNGSDIPIEYNSEDDIMMSDESLPHDPQQQDSIDDFIEYDEVEGSRKDVIDNFSANNDFINDNGGNTIEDEKSDQNTNNVNDVETTNIRNEHMNEITVSDETAEETQPRRSNRSNLGQIDRMVMDHGGKDYRSYWSKQLAHVIESKKRQRKTLKSQLTLLMRKTRETSGSYHQFFQTALKVLFLSPQMNARKGIKHFGERSIAAMLKEFTQLDQGAFPGKPVVTPVHYSSLMEKEKEMAMDAINLIK